MKRLLLAVATAWMMVATTAAQTLLADDGILLNFSSPHCPPCQAMQPVLARIEQLGTPVRHVDVVTEPYLASRFGIRSTPTFIVLKGGKEVTRLVGAQRVEDLQAALATSHSGPLVPTGSTSASSERQHLALSAPQTRLAPMGGEAPHPQSPVAVQSLVSANASPARSEPMPSVTLAEAVERARAATVRLRVHDGNGYGAGTGTIIDTHGDEALVLTCGHLFRETQGKGKTEVDLYVGGQVRTVLGQVIDYDADTRDIALVAIRPGFGVRPIQVASAQHSVQNGQTAFSFGCDRGADPSRRDTRITGVNKYNQHLGVSNLEIAGAPIDGRSGGGLFDEAGNLIGVCNAADYQEDVGIYAGPGSVYWQLDRVGLSHLYKQPGPQMAGSSAPVEHIADLSQAPALLATASQPPASVQQVAAIAPSSLGGNHPAPSTPDHEVIVIVRDRQNPSSTSQVMTLREPSAELLQMIRQQANN